MPQMSPLFWANLFIAFSVLLLISFIKIYFSNSKNLELKNSKNLNSTQNKFYWTW